MYNPYHTQANNDIAGTAQSIGQNQYENHYQQQQQPQHRGTHNQQFNTNNINSNQFGNPNGNPYNQGQAAGQQPVGGNGFGSNNNFMGGVSGGMNSFFNDPASQMGLQFSQSAFNASQQYMQNNLQQIVGNEDIKYYFKVSNAYVLKKLLLIVFPYRNKSWIRQTLNSNGNSNGNVAQGDIYATPIDDVNAPDLYIPSMAFLSYILLWALDAGMRGDFHPEMLGYATTRTLAFYMMDVVLLRTSFYILGIGSKNSKLWDLVSYTGYKFVPILLLLIIEITSGNSVVIRYLGLALLVFSHGFFMMRSLRYVVLPGGGSGESRIKLQCLFAYCFAIQGVFIWLLS